MRKLICWLTAVLLLTACMHREISQSDTNNAHSPPASPETADRYKRLLQYQGHYEYENGATLDIAASPKDPLLYAVIGDARYPLRPVEGDTFINATNQRVVFIRENDGLSYTLPDSGNATIFRRLSTDVSFPPQMWYPRLPGLEYHYTAPEDLQDGLAVGSLYDSTLDVKRIESMVHHIIAGQYPDVHSILIIKDDKLLLEEYFYEYDANIAHILRSATKSIISLLAGIALDQKRIPNLQTPVLSFFYDDYPHLRQHDVRKQNITIEHLLNQTSGLECNDWNPDSVGNESRIAQTDDWVKSFLELPVQHEAGNVASYCSAGVITLGRVIEKASGMPLEQFAEQNLFTPLGITSYHWRFDPDRSSAETFTQISLRPRDMAKIGLLMLHQGKWKGQQIVPAEWVLAATTKHSMLDDTEYGYLWWRPYLNVTGGRHNGIMATGNGGQKITLWLELNMVVVFTGGNYNTNSPTNKLLIHYVLPPK